MVWAFGGSQNPDPMFDPNCIDFRTTPPDFHVLESDITFYITNASICDTAGNLLLYTNGLELRNHAHLLVEGGEVLEVGEAGSPSSGYFIPQSNLLLPFPQRDSQYILFSEEAIFTNDRYVITLKKFKWNIIDMGENDGLGEVILKDSVLLDTPLDWGQITATRHANGRDWWVVVPEFFSNGYFIFLLDPQGVHFQSKQQLGPDVPPNLGQSVFAPNGGKYAKGSSYNYRTVDTLVIMDFDRCSGTLSNPLLITKFDSTSVQGVAISPNSRYLYWAGSRYVYQLDLHAEDIAASMMRVAEWDGFADPFPTNFFLSQLGPDGKIYINSNNGVNYLHTINQPNLPGEACEVCQHCVELPTRNFASMPIFPNYRLGPIDGSPCDTLGIDNLVAVEEVERAEQAELAVYPNPAGESFTVEYSREPHLGQRVVITDITGRPMFNQSFQGKNTEINTSAFPPGLYLVCLLEEGRTIARAKLLVNR